MFLLPMDSGRCEPYIRACLSSRSSVVYYLNFIDVHRWVVNTESKGAKIELKYASEMRSRLGCRSRLLALLHSACYNQHHRPKVHHLHCRIGKSKDGEDFGDAVISYNMLYARAARDCYALVPAMSISEIHRSLRVMARGSRTWMSVSHRKCRLVRTCALELCGRNDVLSMSIQ